MPTAVQFGAGNIGRGFIGQLFSESGYEVVFVDVVQQVVDLLSQRRSYDITIASDTPEVVNVSNVRAVSGRDVALVAAELSRCDIAATAVGVNVLPTVARPIAEGLTIRHGQRPGSFLNIIVCENLRDAAGALRSLVYEQLKPELKEWADQHIGFSQAVVGRMVPIRTPEELAADPIGIRVEAYKKLPVDADALKGPQLQLVGFMPRSNFQAYIDQKLFSHNCGHAAAAYLGAVEKLTYIWEAMEHEEVRTAAQAAMAETSAALITRYGLDPAEQQAHVDDLLSRFANKALGDTVARVGADPIRKLGPDDRLAGAAKFCLQQGVTPAGVARVMACALRFENPSDPSACRLQEMIQEKGIDSVLRELSGIEPDSALGKLVRQSYLTA